MAGLFGMFDPTREGPGVSKDAPKKKRFFLFFEIYFRKFSKLILLNIVYALVCIPIVTIGPATAALTYCMRNFTREEHADLSDFFEQFKKNFKQGLAVGTFFFFAFAIVGFGIFFYNALVKTGNFFGVVGFAISLTTAFLLLFMTYYIYLLMVTFHMTFRQLIKNSFLFSFIGLGRNVITTLIIAIFYGWFVMNFPMQILIMFFDATFKPSLSSACLSLVIYFMFIPSLCTFVSTFNVYPCVKKILLDPAMKEIEENTEEESVFEDTETNEE